MKSYRLLDFGGFDDLKIAEEDVPTPGRGEVLIRVRAASLNFRDLAMATGQYPLEHVAGLIPLSDGAGEIVAVGDEVTSFAVGDNVINGFHPRWFGGAAPADAGSDQYGSSRNGWLTEYKVVSQEAVVPFPDYLTYEEAATLPCAAVTAWTALQNGRPVGPGQTVLTQGTGGVSLFAVQLAKLLGANVIATTSNAEKAEVLRALGADHVVNYRETPTWGEHAKALTGGAGVQRVVEIGGAGTLSQSMRAIAADGEIEIIGFLDSFEHADINFFELFGSGATLRVLAVGDRDALKAMLAAVESVRLKPVIDSVHQFDDAVAGYQRAASGAAVGKVVISI
ncbi:MAG: NAD(P)-dependent alcohol dehydrogenase [Mycobacterium sp.]